MTSTRTTSGRSSSARRSASAEVAATPRTTRNDAYGTPLILSQIQVSRPDTSLTAATSGHRSLVIRPVTGAGIRQVHDRSITSPRRVHDRLRRIQFLTGDTGNPCCMTRRLAAASRSGHRAARHGAVLVFHPGGGDAHLVIPPWNLDKMARADSAARPGPGYEQGQPATRREQDGDEPADRDAQQSGARIRGQNGRGSAKVVELTRFDGHRSSGVYPRGLHALLGAHRRARAEGGEVRFAVTGPAVRRILAIMTIDRVIPVFGRLDEALAPRPGPTCHNQSAARISPVTPAKPVCGPLHGLVRWSSPCPFGVSQHVLRKALAGPHRSRRPNRLPRRAASRSAGPG